MHDVCSCVYMKTHRRWREVREIEEGRKKRQLGECNVMDWRERQILSINVCVMSQDSASGNHELLRCGAVIRSAHFDRRDSFHAIEHLTKDDMFAIEVRARHSGDEKLRAICVRSSVGLHTHGQTYTHREREGKKKKRKRVSNSESNTRASMSYCASFEMHYGRFRPYKRSCGMRKERQREREREWDMMTATLVHA